MKTPDKKPTNLWAKTRKVDNPYLLVTDGDWTWAVLKAYKSRKAELKDPYARWFCAVKSPWTYGQWEFGDVYIIEIPLGDVKTLLPLDDRLIQEAL